MIKYTAITQRADTLMSRLKLPDYLLYMSCKFNCHLLLDLLRVWLQNCSLILLEFPKFLHYNWLWSKLEVIFDLSLKFLISVKPTAWFFCFCSMWVDVDFPSSELCLWHLPQQLPPGQSPRLPPLFLFNFKWSLWLALAFKGIACWHEKWPRCVFFQALRRQRTDGVWRIYETALWIHQQPDEKSI